MFTPKENPHGSWFCYGPRSRLKNKKSDSKRLLLWKTKNNKIN